ncbi:hypothetical protein FRC11_011140 [Ceratobasidium sp. 423]|nr:hypothetical protein FRC11_011140 [Ceratobasidium sp. 423]
MAHVNETTKVDGAENAVRAAKQIQAEAAAKVDEALKKAEELRKRLEQETGSESLRKQFETALQNLGAARLLLEEWNGKVAQAEQEARAARGPTHPFLEPGFVQQTTQFGNNDFFPSTELKQIFHGQDPIIGGPPAKGSTQEVRKVGDISKILKRFVGMGDTRVQAVPKEDVPFKTSDGNQVHSEFKVGEKSFGVSGHAQDPSKHLKDENY